MNEKISKHHKIYNRFYAQSNLLYLLDTLDFLTLRKHAVKVIKEDEKT